MEERQGLLGNGDKPLRHVGFTNSVENDYDGYGATNDTICGERLSEPTANTGVYWWRWYILIVFCCIAALENITWNTWGPIESSARAYFGWSKGEVSLLADWGPITFLIAVFPSSWLLDTRGLRPAVLLCGLFLVVGSGVRIITKEVAVATPLIHIGQFILGLGGPVAQSAATVVSCTWFPPHQRTTATAISSLAVYMGTAVSFLIGPALVSDVESMIHHNATHNSTQMEFFISDAVKAHLGDQIMNLLYVEFGLCAFFFVLALVAFPGRPPLPPSATAALARVDYMDGFICLLKNPQFQLIAFLYGITSGVYSAWCSDLALNLSEFNISNNMASWLGFSAVVAGSVAGILLSLVADFLGGFMKVILIGLFVFATAGFAVFALICLQVIPHSNVAFFVTSIIGGMCLNGAIPLFFELSVESSYPVAEGVNTGFMTFSNNFYCLIFLTFPLIHGLGTRWMNWAMIGSCAVCIPLLFLFKERYRRLEIDVKVERSPSVEHHSDAVNA